MAATMTQPISSATAATLQNGKTTTVSQDKEQFSQEKDTTESKQRIHSKNNSTFFKGVTATKSFTSRWISPIVTWGCLVSGLATFGLTNIKGEENETANIVSTALSKTSLFVNGGYGLLQNMEENNTIGTVGYLGDLATSIKSDAKNIYFFRFLGTALDQAVAMVEDFSIKNPDLIEKNYNESSDKFLDYKSYGDSLGKACFATEHVFKHTVEEITNTFKNEGCIAAIKDYFDKSRADANILGSSIGVLISGIVGSIGMATGQELIEKIGKTGRDIEGFHCDYGVFLKKYSINPKTGKSTAEGCNDYGLSGALYALAGILDIFSIWIPDRGFHFASLGFDRFASRLMVSAQEKGTNGRANSESKD